jgi:mRNA-degrading endonuclease toxin of MazEF toxin-antitoxin module
MRAVDTEKGLDTQVGILSFDDMRQVDQALRIALDLYR